MKNIALIKSKNGIWSAFNNVLIRKNYSPNLLDPFSNKDLEFLLNNNWDALVWVAKHNAKIKNLAKKILYTFDSDKQMHVYPDWNSYWHYDDKVSQYFLLHRNNIPIPETRVFFDWQETKEYLKDINYPVVFKYESGAGSSNVSIIKNKKEGSKEIDRAFNKGVNNFIGKKAAKNHLIIQEFQKNNSGDYRLVCYGDEILGFFRSNRENEPLASGSNNFVFKEIPIEILDLVYNISKKFGYKVMSYDILEGNNSKWVISEISVVYGDIDFDVYNKARLYKLNNTKWQEVETEQPHYERVAEYLINSWFANE